jgi:hypothetical protein
MGKQKGNGLKESKRWVETNLGLPKSIEELFGKEERQRSEVGDLTC